jgi:hypothetical protein
LRVNLNVGINFVSVRTIKGRRRRRLWHSSTPNSRFLSHSPSDPPPSFTQSPYRYRFCFCKNNKRTIIITPRSLVRDEQTHPHRPRFVVSHSTCPPLSSSPHAHSFVIGPAVIKHTRSSASGSPTLGMLVETLVERVFLVSGVGKTVFFRVKKK